MKALKRQTVWTGRTYLRGNLAICSHKLKYSFDVEILLLFIQYQELTGREDIYKNGLCIIIYFF